MEIEFKTHEDNVARIEKKIAKLNKRAAKFGTAPLSMTYTVALEKDHSSNVTPVAHVTVVGDVPVVTGYTFAGHIAHTAAGNLVTTILKGFEMPVEMRQAAPTCDHCNTKRRRNDTYVLVKGGEQIRVGRNCLADFLRTQSAIQALQNVTALKSIKDEFADDGACGNYGGASYPSVHRIIACAAASVRRSGWAASAASKSTASDVSFLVSKPHPTMMAEWQAAQPTDKDLETATAAIAWLLDQDSTTNYMHNLQVVCTLGYVTHKTFNLTVSAIKAYLGNVERKAKAAARPESKHVGAIGQRVTFDRLTVVRTRYISNAFAGKTIIAFTDEHGNDLTWFAAGDLCDEYNAGDVFTGKGTVKAHEAYQGRPQTTIARCSLWKVNAAEAG